MTQCDASASAIAAASANRFDGSALRVEGVVADNEGALPFGDASFDAVLSSLSLHWVNDVDTLLSEVRRVLRPDGVFVGALLGAGTLGELQYAFAAGEEERTGGVQPHASPAARVADCGALLTRAGFKLVTVDVEKIVVDYADAFLLMDDLQRMGEQRAPADAGTPTSRDAFLAAAAAYQALFPSSAGAGAAGPVKATFEVVFLIGWAPHASQPKPDRRGSATARIGDLPPGPPPTTWAPDGSGFKKS